MDSASDVHSIRQEDTRPDEQVVGGIVMRELLGVLIGVGVGIALGVSTGNVGVGVGVGAGLAVVFGGGAFVNARRA